MTAANFDALLKVLIGVEGGISDRPLKDDPGGLTASGVTQATYDAWRRSRGRPIASVRRITVTEYTELYREQFWNTIRGDELPDGIDCAVFDMSVNSGPGRAALELQRIIGVKADGVIGVASLAALQAADPLKVINDYCDRRLIFMKGLKNWRANRNGWTTRVAHIRDVALDMAHGEPPPAQPVVTLAAEDSGKALDSKQAALKSPDSIGLGSLAAGAGGDKLLGLSDQAKQFADPHTVLGRLATAALVLLMLFGGTLLLYSNLRRINDKGGLRGLLKGILT